MLTALHEVRRIVALLAMGRPLESGMCSQWTSRHWEIVLSERLGPWFYKCLCDRVDVGINSDVLARLRRDYRLSAIASLYREVALRKLLAAFNACGIPVILLKGSYLGRFVYKDAALRPMEDVDLLVREEHFDQAGHELERLEYRPLFDLDQDEDRLLKLPMVYQVSSPVPGLIDLHRRVRSMDYYIFPAEILWEEAVGKEFYGYQVFYLSAELNFIHLALHNFDHPGSLRDWVDLVTVVRSMNLDWDRLMLLAGSLRAVRPLFWVFRELGRNWETRPPKSVSVPLDSYVPAWLEDRVIRHRFRYLWRLAARIAWLDGWRSRLRYFAIKFVPPSNKTDRSRISSYVAHLRSKVILFHHLWRRS
jgi:hypothetical protein